LPQLETEEIIFSEIARKLLDRERLLPIIGRRLVANRREITCDDCFFRRADLCALPGNKPCPTFRPASGALDPPPHPRLVVRALERAHAAA
jgi:hypothetical protein